MSLNVEIIVDDCLTTPLPLDRLSQAVWAAAKSRGFHCGEIGIRVTDDPTIAELNARHLDHDYETDVISFPYGADDSKLSGELVVSAQTAHRRARELGWSAENELLLYVVHGVLHITGMDDHEPSDRAMMRQAEQQVMLDLGIEQILRFGVDRDGNGQTSDSSEASG